jgi:F-type H+-transporting ATPase subunit b
MNINFTLIAQAITFAIFIWFTVKFVWPPLLNAIEKRQKEIADGLAAANEGKMSLEVASKKNAEALEQTKQKSSEILGQAEKRAAQIIDDAKVAANTEAERIKSSAQSEIEQEINRAKEDLRGQISNLAIAGAEKILEKEIDQKTHADMLTKLAKDL